MTIAGRCETHDKASPAVIARLEEEAGIEPSAAPASFTEAYANPNLIGCGKRRCRARREAGGQ